MENVNPTLSVVSDAVISDPANELIGRYSFTSSHSKNSEEDDLIDSYSYFSNAVATLERKNSDAIQEHSSKQSISQDSSGAMWDIPVKENNIIDRIDCLRTEEQEEAVVFDEKEKSNSLYYDVLHLAQDRLNNIELRRSSSDDAILEVKKKKKKKSKSKSKLKSNKLRSKAEKTLTRLTPSQEKGDYASSDIPVDSLEISKKPLEMTEFVIGDSEDVYDPNDKIPMSSRSNLWNPASLVSTAASNKGDAKLDKNGFYKMFHGHSRSKKASVRSTAASVAYENVKQLIRGKKDTEIPSYFNLQSIKSKRSKFAAQNCDSIIWGDESVTEHEIEDRIEMMDDCSYTGINYASQDYFNANDRLMKRISRRKNRRCVITALCGGIIFLIVTFSLYGASIRRTFERDDSLSGPNPPLPLPNDHFYGSGSPITSLDLDSIIADIITDQSVISNTSLPQSKAYKWCKNDLLSYDINVTARVAERFALATLYYSTNGTGWSNSSGWLNGHECSWYGISCEVRENNSLSITVIDLSNNALSGTVPSELAVIDSLTQLHLWGNDLFGTIPSSLPRLANLETLFLDRCQLTGEIYNTVDLLPSLKHLDLSYNKLKGKIPHGLGGVTSLIDLRLSQNLFTGAFPLSLSTLPNIKTLFLDNNRIGGTLPASVGKMLSLVILHIQGNNFIGELPDFSSAVYLEEAHLNNNDFSGTIPKFGSRRLRSLYLGGNALTGSIPDSIGSLSKLEALFIQTNHLIGTLPTLLSNLTALQHIDVSFNRLTGQIQDVIHPLFQLRGLILNDNRFTGNIPDIAPLKRLEVARLNSNLLSGELKFSFDIGTMNYLKEFSLHNNYLTGVIPEYICDLLLDMLTSDCWGSSSLVDCSCCTKCF